MKSRKAFFRTVLLATFVVSSLSVFSKANDGRPAPLPAHEKPKQLEGIGIEEKLGAQLDLSLQFKDEEGNAVTLGQYFNGKNPVIVSPVYYSCPGLCNFHLNGLVDGLKTVDWSAGTKYQVVAISFDPKETPDLAKKKKENYLKVYDRKGTDSGWHFLTGDAENIKKLTDSVGFKYKWNDKDQEWSHASAAIIASPQGILSRYIPGIMFEARDLKLALNEASQGKIGTFIDALVLYCFHYDPHQSQYTLAAVNVMKLGGGLTILVLGLWLIPFWRRSQRKNEKVRS